MINSTQKLLDAILALLKENQEIRPIRERSLFQGTRENDIFFGTTGNVIANGRSGDDTLVGKRGDDRFSGGQGDDMMIGGNGLDTLAGNSGTDSLFADSGTDQLNGGNGSDYLDGGIDADTLIGGNGADQLVGGGGIDKLTGGADNDQIIYSGNLFANGTPALAGQTGIKVLNQPDIVTDYTVGQDQFVFDKQSTGISNIVFQKGISSQLADGNVIVLQDSFAAAGAAARAIANNPNIQADEGIFVYFNTTLGLNRVVYSRDLSDGGNMSVLANIDNQRGSTGLANLTSFTTADFALA